MEYLKKNIQSFKIEEYFKSINAQFRETAEEEFKKLVTSVIVKFETNAKNKPLLQFAARMRDTRFEVLYLLKMSLTLITHFVKVLRSSTAEGYWDSVTTASIKINRLQGHLYDEQSIADVILGYAKKRHRSNRGVNDMVKISECLRIQKLTIV